VPLAALGKNISCVFVNWWLTPGDGESQNGRCPEGLGSWQVAAAARSVAGSSAAPITTETQLGALRIPPATILQQIRGGQGSGDQGSDKVADDIRTIGDLVGYLSARVFPSVQVADDDPKLVTSACNPSPVALAPFDTGLLRLAY
jgi:hypothetical protein